MLSPDEIIRLHFLICKHPFSVTLRLMLQQIQLHRNFHKRSVIMICQIQIQYFTDLGVSIFDGIIVNIESCSGFFQIPAILQDFLQGGPEVLRDISDRNPPAAEYTVYTVPLIPDCS